MNRLLFVRHGENRANLTKEFSHRKVDYPLTPKGRLQAFQTAQVLRGQRIQAIYTSPLKRASETADMIARELGLGVTPLENFREVNVGHFEDLPPTPETWARHNQIVDAWWQGQREVGFPGGENQEELWQRMRAGLDIILDGNDGQTILIVLHGGILTFTLKEFCPQVDLAWLRQAVNHNCSISEIWVNKQGSAWQGQLISWAAYGHLHGEAAELVSGVPDLENFNPTPISGSPARCG